MFNATDKSSQRSKSLANSPDLDAYRARVSHDLRTTLTAILGYADLLVADDCSDDDRVEFALTIRRNGERVQTLSNQLLADARATLSFPALHPNNVVDETTVDVSNEVASPVLKPITDHASVSSPPQPKAEYIAPTSEVPVTAGPAFESVACGLTPSAFDSAAATSYGGNGRVSGSVLVAEDSKDNQRLITFLLRHFGLDFTIAENGAIALELARSAVEAGRPFDLVLMDVGMPVMDGLQSTHAMRSEGMTMPIVALTAHAMAGDRERCLSAGCSDYISKPIERLALLKMLTRYLSVRDGAETTAPASVATLVPIAQSDGGRERLQQLPAVVATTRDSSNAGNDVILRTALAQLKQTASELGLNHAAALASAAESALRLGAERSIIRKAVDEAIACARRADGYDVERERLAA